MGSADGQSWLQAEKRRTRHPERIERMEGMERPPLFEEVAEGGGYRPTEAIFAMREAIDGGQAPIGWNMV